MFSISSIPSLSGHSTNPSVAIEPTQQPEAISDAEELDTEPLDEQDMESLAEDGLIYRHREIINTDTIKTREAIATTIANNGTIEFCGFEEIRRKDTAGILRSWQANSQQAIIESTSTPLGLSEPSNTVPENIEIPATEIKPPEKPKLGKIRVFSATSAKAQWPEAEVSVPIGYKMIGGGARVNWAEPGNLLTASYPKTLNTWAARSKDHALVSPATIDVWAIGISDPNDDFDVVIDSAKSLSMQHPEVSVNARSGYQLVGGGAEVNWTGFGNLLTASYPLGTVAWQAKSKDHMHPDPSVLTAYAISMRPKNGTTPIPIQIKLSNVSPIPHPKGECKVPEGFNLIGGGAAVNWTGVGSLLTASYPRDNAWVAEAKDHQVSDPSSMTIYSIGIDIRDFA